MLTQAQKFEAWRERVALGDKVRRANDAAINAALHDADNATLNCCTLLPVDIFMNRRISLHDSYRS